jgi:hypothetical protein
MPGLHLVPGRKDVERTLIALSRNDADGCFRMKRNDLPCQFFEGIPCGSCYKVLHIPDIFPGEDIRQGVTVDFAIDNEQIDNALLEPLLDLLSDFMIHGDSFLPSEIRSYGNEAGGFPFHEAGSRPECPIFFNR